MKRGFARGYVVMGLWLHVGAAGAYLCASAGYTAAVLQENANCYKITRENFEPFVLDEEIDSRCWRASHRIFGDSWLTLLVPIPQTRQHGAEPMLGPDAWRKE